MEYLCNNCDKVGQHYVTFFEKTLDFLDEISRRVSIKTEYLKQMEDWQKQGGEWNRAGLLTVLGAIYYDTISFCQRTHQIFGSARKGASCVSQEIGYLFTLAVLLNSNFNHARVGYTSLNSGTRQIASRL